MLVMYAILMFINVLITVFMAGIGFMPMVVIGLIGVTASIFGLLEEVDRIL